MAEEVSSGRYKYFKREELDVEKQRYKDAVKMMSKQAAASGGGRIVAGGVAGQNSTFAFPDGISSFDVWGEELDFAFAQLNDETIASRQRVILVSGSFE